MRVQNRSPFQARMPEYRIEAKKNETTFYIYDEIGWFGISAQQFAEDIEKIKGGIINIRINSPGGSVFDGMAIYNAIKQHSAKTVIYIDGLAASIASVIALAGDEVVMAENAFMMIHEPWGLVIGPASEMRSEADLLDKLAGSLIKTYMAASDKDEKEIKKLMAAETWFDADEALEIGFVDKIFDVEEEEENEAAALFDLTVFNNVPDKLQTKEKELTERDAEKALRDAGFARSRSKEILAKGFKGESNEREAQEEEARLQAERDALAEEEAHLREAEEAEAEEVVDEPEFLTSIRSTGHIKPG